MLFCMSNELKNNTEVPKGLTRMTKIILGIIAFAATAAAGSKIGDELAEHYKDTTTVQIPYGQPESSNTFDI